MIAMADLHAVISLFLIIPLKKAHHVFLNLCVQKQWRHTGVLKFLS